MHDELTEQVMSALAKVKHIPRESITPESALDSLRLDSLDKISLLFELEEMLGSTIPDDQLHDVRTVGDVVDKLRSLKDAAAAGS